jgi:lipid-binding SYLF domain-containing protein
VLSRKPKGESISSTTLPKGIYAYFINQSLMAGMGLHGSKIAKFYPQ